MFNVLEENQYQCSNMHRISLHLSDSSEIVVLTQIYFKLKYTFLIVSQYL
jgi:hypothetical protein